MPTDLLTPEAIRAIQVRAETALPGPWHRHDAATTFGVASRSTGYKVILVGYVQNSPLCSPRTNTRRSHTMDFIAAARTDVPALCATALALHERLALADEEIVRLQGYNLELTQRHKGCHAERDELAARVAALEEALRALHDRAESGWDKSPLEMTEALYWIRMDTERALAHARAAEEDEHV